MIYTLQTHYSLVTQVRNVVCCFQTILIPGWDIHKFNRYVFYKGNLIFIRDQIPQPPLNKICWIVYQLPLLFIRDGLLTSASLHKGSNPFTPLWANMLNGLLTSTSLHKGSNSPPPLNKYVEWFINFHFSS